MRQFLLILVQLIISLFFVVGGFALALLFLHFRDEHYVISSIHYSFYIVGIVIGILSSNILRLFTDLTKTNKD